MSVLMLMRQRMKAIETIQKITHAMQLISMSSHTRLRNKKAALAHYTSELLNLFTHIYAHDLSWHHPILLPRVHYEDDVKKEHILIILVGSQKGLCGTFNQHLFSFFEREESPEHKLHAHYIAVGKRACDYLAHAQDRTVIKQFNEFTYAMITPIAQQITDYIMHATPHYTSVTVYSNWSKSFFVQVPAPHTVVPLTLPQAAQEDDGTDETYEWEQSPETLLTSLAQSILLATMQDLLLTSLTAEQAARFVAMDNSTRNAHNLLDQMTLDYNKRRQAKITRELTDLIGSL